MRYIVKDVMDAIRAKGKQMTNDEYLDFLSDIGDALVEEMEKYE